MSEKEEGGGVIYENKRVKAGNFVLVSVKLGCSG